MGFTLRRAGIMASDDEDLPVFAGEVDASDVDEENGPVKSEAEDNEDYGSQLRRPSR